MFIKFLPKKGEKQFKNILKNILKFFYWKYGSLISSLITFRYDLIFHKDTGKIMEN